jgi:hypothetical protein
MNIKVLALIILLAAGAGSYDAPMPGDLTTYQDEQWGFSFNYPEYWSLVTDTDEMLDVQDGTIDLISEEDFTQKERDSYRVMVHVDGSPRYVSNVAFLVYPHRDDGRIMYDNAESAVLAVVDEFTDGMASGTWFLEETYLGESHTYVYRRRVRVPEWNDEIIITYYLTASRANAYMIVKTVLNTALSDTNLDQFNQVIQSFRVEANESGAIDPSLDWGSFKPGEDGTSGEDNTEVGRNLIREDFRNNSRGWPVEDDAEIRNDRYILDSITRSPFVVFNTSLGQIEFDFSYEGEVEFLDGDETAGYGLVFGYRDEDNYFAFLVTADGHFIVPEEKQGVVTELIPWTDSDLLDEGMHTLMVQGDYQTVTDPDVEHRYELIFYIDGQPVGTARTNRVLDVSGWYGIFVSEDLEVAFDWLESRNFIPDAVMTLERFE